MPDPDARPLDITTSEAEEASTVRPGRLRFAPAVEARFEADTGARRCRRLFAATAIGMVFYVLGLKADAALLADVFQRALTLKLGLIVPLFALSLLVFSSNPRPWLRETFVPVTAIAIMLVQVSLVLESSSPLAVYAHYSAPIDIIFANLIVRARFWYAFAASVSSLAVYAVGMQHLAGLPFEAYAGAVMQLAAVVACTLYANFQLERDERRAYAAALREEVRSADLSHANRELNRISKLDSMTGLANRRGFDQRFDALWHASKIAHEPLAVLMLDVDYFKPFNDRYGHQAGDACLEAIAEILRTQVRGDRLVARYGGEEFVAVLPRADLLDGMRVAERVRRAIEARAIPHASAPSRIVTVSVGVSAAPATSDSLPKDVIESADAALYEAKGRGRNRVWPPILKSETVRARGPGGGEVADVA